MYKIYEKSNDNKFRYALGNDVGNILYVIGINPSIATDIELDPTLKNVKTFSKILEFDSFMMFNIYPQRSTNPDDMDKKMNLDQVNKNIQIISKYLVPNCTIWAAWGETINKRPYLIKALRMLHENIKSLNVKWIQYDDLTKTGHPRHPSRKKHEDRFREFKIEDYL
ncbi:MAG: hypothetical protein CME71_02060 [Halobacteriovorax sp.]|nr:hypothetical protein [Halobacteriovorax sp.]|tara:strand:+ start:3269 stop:3769 length:501 start_codon:yes stop_codon:yes gene_type:complete